MTRKSNSNASSVNFSPLLFVFVFAFCFEKIIVEIKAVKELTAEHCAQVFNYLHATGFKLGLLVNFGYYPKVESERIVL